MGMKLGRENYCDPFLRSPSKSEPGHKATWSRGSATTGDDKMDELLHQLETLMHDLRVLYTSDAPEHDEAFYLASDAAMGRILQQVGRLRGGRRRKTDVMQNQAWSGGGLQLFGHRPVPSLKEAARKVIVSGRIVKHWRCQSYLDLESRIGDGASSARSSVVTSVSVTEDPMGEVDVRSWTGVDVFRLEEKPVGSLVLVFHSIWKKEDWGKLCQCELTAALGYMEALGNLYAKNPYHNRAHAADVTAIVYYLWSNLRSTMKDFVAQVDVLLGVLAGAMHDVGHPAVNNDFLVKTKDALALRYNDQSVLENYHVATSFELMHERGVDLLAHKLGAMPPTSALRRRIIDMVLATDMARHKQALEAVSMQLEAAESPEEVDKLPIEQLIVHLSDLGHPLRPFRHHNVWSQKVTEEFFNQGDREKELGFIPMPLLDRTKAPSLAKGQTGFMNFVVQPTFDLFCRFNSMFAELPPAKCMQENIDHWQKEVAEEEAQEAREKELKEMERSSSRQATMSAALSGAMSHQSSRSLAENADESRLE